MSRRPARPMRISIARFGIEMRIGRAGLWGSNVPQTRTPDAHFYTEARYRGAKSVVISPDYSEASKFADLWISVKQGTDAALAMAMGHVILKEFHLERPSEYFQGYARRYTDLPMLVKLVKREGR